MRVDEAKQLVLDLISVDRQVLQLPTRLDARSPDPRDPGKFLLAGRPARAIHHFDGWYVPIDLGWFTGGVDMPRIHGGEFYWLYAFEWGADASATELSIHQ